MNQNKKIIILGLLMLTFSFYSCKKETIHTRNASEPKVKKNEVLSYGNYNISYEEVEDAILLIGASEVSAPPLIVNPYIGTTSVRHFEVPGLATLLCLFLH
jgi:hypothetical protein